MLFCVALILISAISVSGVQMSTHEQIKWISSGYDHQVIYREYYSGDARCVARLWSKKMEYGSDVFAAETYNVYDETSSVMFGPYTNPGDAIMKLRDLIQRDCDEQITKQKPKYLQEDDDPNYPTDYDDSLTEGYDDIAVQHQLDIEDDIDPDYVDPWYDDDY